MAKRLTTTDISRLSGVSRGTVDRILHNRGGVSKESMKKVNAVLEKYGYKFNIHTSAVPFSKVFHLLVCLPKYSSGDFLSQIRQGIGAAVEEYYDIDIEVIDVDFAPFDSKDYLDSVRSALSGQVDGAILSPVFPEESREVCKLMDESKIPYVFVDLDLTDTNPVAVFSIDQNTGGKMLACIIDAATAKDDDIAIILADNFRGVRHTYSSRRLGVESYFASVKRKGEVHFVDIDISSAAMIESSIADCLNAHPGVKGVAVTNARGCTVSSCLEKLGRKDIVVVSFDLTKENAESLESGRIAALICQKPVTQGYKAVIEILRSFMYNDTSKREYCYQSIDIVVKDNLPYYKDLDR